MTQMGLDYQKFKESQRHNIANENIDSREVATKEYTTSFEPYRVGATVTQAKAAATNAATNKYTASFEPRRVAATEKQAQASMKQANVQESRYELDAAWRSFEENLKAQEVGIKQARNDIDMFKAQFNALPDATKTVLAAAGLNLDNLGMTIAGIESGMDKGASYLSTIANAVRAFKKK